MEQNEPTPPPDAPKRGRPQHPIDGDQVYKLARLGVSNSEIADFFGCSPSTVKSRFAGELAQGRAGMKISLRRQQLKRAAAGSDAILIHLGKTLLGQSEKAVSEHRFGFGMSHEEALAALEGWQDDPDRAKEAFMRKLPMLTVEYVAAPPRDEAGNLLSPDE